MDFDYDVLGQLISVTDSAAGTLTYDYNGKGELTSTVDGQGDWREYEYDQVGRMVQTWNNEGKLDRYHYDKPPINIPVDWKGEALPGALLAITSESSANEEWYAHSPLGAITQKIDIINDDIYEHDYEYDKFGRLSKTHYPKSASAVDELSVSRSYSKNGNLESLSATAAAGSPVPLWSVAERDASGRVVRSEAGPTETKKLYDVDGRFEDVAVEQDGVVTSGFSYTYTDNGNVFTRENSDGLFESFGYDALNRLISASGLPGVWSYDQFGNINGVNPSRQDGQMVKTLTQDVEYDGDGQLTHYVGEYRNVALAGNTYTSDITWNADGQPTLVKSSRKCCGSFSAEGAVGDEVVELLYGLSGALVERNATYTGDETIERSTIYVGGDFESYHAKGANASNLIVPGAPNITKNVDRVTVHAEGETVVVIEREKADTRYHYIHADNLGSAERVTAVGTNGNSYDDARRYDVWGNLVDQTILGDGGEPTSVNVGYTGHRDERDGGMIDMGLRHYDPDVRKFLSPDPFVAQIYDTQAWNKYSYASNNPATLYDPTGGFSVRRVVGGGGGGISATLGAIAGALGASAVFGRATGGSGGGGGGGGGETSSMSIQQASNPLAFTDVTNGHARRRGGFQSGAQGNRLFDFDSLQQSWTPEAIPNAAAFGMSVDAGIEPVIESGVKVGVFGKYVDWDNPTVYKAGFDSYVDNIALMTVPVWVIEGVTGVELTPGIWIRDALGFGGIEQPEVYDFAQSRFALMQMLAAWKIGSLPRAACAGGRCGLPGGVCFVAGTEVWTADGQVAIETLRVGDRVLTAGEDSSSETLVDESWRLVHLTMPNPDGSDDLIEVSALRSPAWMMETGAENGSHIYFRLEEMALEGWARVDTVEPAPPVATGPGRVVLLTVTHFNGFVHTLTFESEADNLELTARHRLFSLDRQAWVPAADLLVGERLETANGARVIASNKKLEGVHRVYNLEVETEHSYLTSEIGVLSHNVSDCGELGGFAKAVGVDEIAKINQVFGGTTTLTGSIDSALAGAYRYEGFFNKSAAVIRGIAGSHLFDNGNKRTAQAVYELLRRRNGVVSGVGPVEVRNIIGQVSRGELTGVVDIAQALRGF